MPFYRHSSANLLSVKWHETLSSKKVVFWFSLSRNLFTIYTFFSKVRKKYLVLAEKAFVFIWIEDEVEYVLSSLQEFSRLFFITRTLYILSNSLSQEVILPLWWLHYIGPFQSFFWKIHLLICRVSCLHNQDYVFHEICLFLANFF